MGKMYLGDGVYVENDGFNIILSTSNGAMTTNTIFLDPYVMEAFLSYCQALKASVEKDEHPGS